MDEAEEGKRKQECEVKEKRREFRGRLKKSTLVLRIENLLMWWSSLTMKYTECITDILSSTCSCSYVQHVAKMSYYFT